MVCSRYFSLQDLVETHFGTSESIDIFIEEFTDSSKLIFNWAIAKNHCIINVFVKHCLSEVLDMFYICDKNNINSFNLVFSESQKKDLFSNVISGLKSIHYVDMKIFPKIRIAIDSSAYNDSYMKSLIKTAMENNINVQSSGLKEVKERWSPFLGKMGLFVV